MPRNPHSDSTFLWVKVSGRPNSCSEKRIPLTSVSGEQRKPGRHELEQERFEGEHRQGAVAAGGRCPAVHAPLEPQQEQRLQRRHREERVGHERRPRCAGWPTSRVP